MLSVLGVFSSPKEIKQSVVANDQTYFIIFDSFFKKKVFPSEIISGEGENLSFLQIMSYEFSKSPDGISFFDRRRFKKTLKYIPFSNFKLKYKDKEIVFSFEKNSGYFQAGITKEYNCIPLKIKDGKFSFSFPVFYYNNGFSFDYFYISNLDPEETYRLNGENFGGYVSEKNLFCFLKKKE